MSALLSHWTDVDFCSVTTIGRRTGRPHTVEVWFAVHEDRLFIISSADADWVRNAVADPRVIVRVGTETREGRARVVTDPAEAAIARRLLPQKYRTREEGLEEWAEESTPVAVDFDR